MPIYAAIFMIFTMANVGLPGTSGFVGEFLTLLGTFKVNVAVATIATLGVILSAAYALWLYRKMIFGKLEKPKLQSITDVDSREITIFVPLVALTLLFGFWPKPVLDISSASVNALVAQYQQAIGAKKVAEKSAAVELPIADKIK
jgi:NADH-quinone oxidoreductase subunit M